MSSERVALRLRDIIENVGRIESHIRGLNFDTVGADQKSIDAVERCIERITEAAIKIGPERMAQVSPTTPIEVVRGMGNALRHDYDGIDLGIIWLTATVSLPLLREDCRRELANFPTE